MAREAARRCLHLLEWYELQIPAPWSGQALTLAELRRLWRVILLEAL